MADCKCGAPVTWVQLMDKEERVPLDSNVTVTSGRRFTITSHDTEPWTAVELDPLRTAAGHPDHRASCPFQ